MTPHELVAEWEALNIKPKQSDTEDTSPPYVALTVGDYTYVIDPNQGQEIPA